MLDAIVSGLALLRSLSRSTDLPADIDLVAGATDEGAVIAEMTQLLVAALVDEMAAGEGHRSLADSSALGELHELTKAATFRVSAAQRRDALGDAAAIIREAGLERHDLDCHFGTDRDGRDVIVSAPHRSGHRTRVAPRPVGRREEAEEEARGANVMVAETLADPRSPLVAAPE
jgi:hypothetical protein